MIPCAAYRRTLWHRALPWVRWCAVGAVLGYGVAWLARRVAEAAGYP